MNIRTTIARTAVNASRLLVALTFIFSGFVKAIDPLGTQYKLTDYLTAMGLVAWVPSWATLAASVLLSAVEFSLGVFLLFAIRRKLVPRLILVVMAFMTLLTLWIAIANPVKDCGCFGDAVVLSNTATLLKNVVLLALTLVICRWPGYMPRFVHEATQWIVVNYTVLFILATSACSLWWLPLFDFRPYHIGADIKKGMEIPRGAKQPKFDTTFILEKNGERREFTLDDYPDSTWTFVDSRTEQVGEGYTPPIHDLTMEDRVTGDDLTQQILHDRGYTLLLVAPHLEAADDSNFGDIDQIYEYAQDHGYAFYALTASGDKAIQRWRDITGAEYPFLFTDETTLKTMIRSNPGLMLLKDGRVIRKWSHNQLPELNEQTPELSKTPEGQLPGEGLGTKIAKTILWFFLPLLLLTAADRTWAWTRWLKRKEKTTIINSDKDNKQN